MSHAVATDLLQWDVHRSNAWGWRKGHYTCCALQLFCHLGFAIVWSLSLPFQKLTACTAGRLFVPMVRKVAPTSLRFNWAQSWGWDTLHGTGVVVPHFFLPQSGCRHLQCHCVLAGAHSPTHPWLTGQVPAPSQGPPGSSGSPWLFLFGWQNLDKQRAISQPGALICLGQGQREGQGTALALLDLFPTCRCSSFHFTLTAWAVLFILTEGKHSLKQNIRTCQACLSTATLWLPAHKKYPRNQTDQKNQAHIPKPTKSFTLSRKATFASLDFKAVLGLLRQCRYRNPITLLFPSASTAVWQPCLWTKAEESCLLQLPTATSALWGNEATTTTHPHLLWGMKKEWRRDDFPLHNCSWEEGDTSAKLPESLGQRFCTRGVPRTRVPAAASQNLRSVPHLSPLCRKLN